MHLVDKLLWKSFGFVLETMWYCFWGCHGIRILLGIFVVCLKVYFKVKVLDTKANLVYFSKGCKRNRYLFLLIFMLKLIKWKKLTLFPLFISGRRTLKGSSRQMPHKLSLGDRSLVSGKFHFHAHWIFLYAIRGIYLIIFLKMPMRSKFTSTIFYWDLKHERFWNMNLILL